MKEKAARAFHEAQFLAQHAEQLPVVKEGYDGAANRIYYALRHAIIAALEARKLRPEQFPDTEGKTHDRWKHAVVLIACKEVLPSQHLWSVGEALALRVQADYRRDPVEAEDFYRISLLVDEMLTILGIPEE